MQKPQRFAGYHAGPFGKIPAPASLFGVLFALAFVFLGWIGLPDYRWFWIASVIGGTVVGSGLHYWHKRSKPEVEKLSIRP